MTRRNCTTLRSVAALIGLALIPLSGCATAPEAASSTQPLTASAYTTRFQAARDELLESGWVLDRVDARAGVLTTRPRAGVVRTAQDVLDRLDRVVRVEFRPTNTASATDPSRIDLTEGNIATDMRVRVFIQRTYYPGWRPSSTSVRLGSRHTDPELVAKDIQPRSEMTAAEDAGLAEDIAARIAARSGQTSKSAQQQSSK